MPRGSEGAEPQQQGTDDEQEEGGGPRDGRVPADAQVGEPRAGEIDVIGDPERLAELDVRLVEPTRDTLEQMFECVSTIP